MKTSYASLLEAINGLRADGYIEDFNLRQDCIECHNGDYKLFSDEFEVDKYYRFDVNSDPSDQSIVYAISSKKDNLKGVLVNAYGIYSEPMTDEMVHKLDMPGDR
jgi:hypothetical protein